MIPEGMRDVLPAEVAEVHAIEEVLRRRFACYGYGEVRTPTVEFAEMLQRAGDDTLGTGLRLFDEQGRALMLRTDMTVPVARLATTRFRDKSLPLRFCYLADSFRPLAVHRGQHGEFAQAGAELLGLGTAATDAEIVTLLCDALAASGLPEFRVSIGTTAFHAALVASLQLTPEDAEATLEALAERDYPLLETIVANAGLGDDARRALEKSLERAGGRESLTQARRLATTGGMDAALDHLEAVRDLVTESGFGDHLIFDLGLYQDLRYYSGLVFEAYAPGVGLPIASGGRYDGLMARFDWEIPAVGCAISLDRLHEALVEGGVHLAEELPLAFAGGLEEPERAAELRRAGIAVAALPAGRQQLPPPSLARSEGQYHLELADGRDVRGSWHQVLRALGVS